MITFKNEGLIALEAITTMGLNVKMDASAIGHFGTGLKLSIATILRNGGHITIHRGKEPLNFFVKTKLVRGKSFDFIYYRKGGKGISTPLGITTELGKNWQAWMTVRELESNCRDEKGKSGSSYFEPEEGYTTIVVDWDEFSEAYDRLNEFFVSSRPIHSSQFFELHQKISDSDNAFFFQGIKVGELERSFPYRVNLTKDLRGQLTEDRTLAPGHAHRLLATYLPEIDNIDILSTVFPPEADRELLIHHLNFDQICTNPSDNFFNLMRERNANDILSVPTSVFNLMASHGKFDRRSLIKEIPMNDIELQMLEKAWEFVAHLGYDLLERYDVIKVELGSGTYALADTKYRQIQISPAVFDMGQKYLCSTLYEEYLHLRFSYSDCSRALQQHLFDRMSTIMEQHFYKRPM